MGVCFFCSDLWFGLGIRNIASQTDTLGTSFLGVLNWIINLFIYRRNNNTSVYDTNKLSIFCFGKKKRTK